MEEIRVVDPTTGGEKGSKLARFSLIPCDFLWALAEHYGRGARKYADRNWERGYKWSLTVDAMQRHLALWMNGEDDDPETGSSHLIAVAWHVVALWWFHRHGRGTDDVRSKIVGAVAGESLDQPFPCEAFATLTGAPSHLKESMLILEHVRQAPEPFTCPQDGEENCCPGNDKMREECRLIAERRRGANRL